MCKEFIREYYCGRKREDGRIGQGEPVDHDGELIKSLCFSYKVTGFTHARGLAGKAHRLLSVSTPGVEGSESRAELGEPCHEPGIFLRSSFSFFFLVPNSNTSLRWGGGRSRGEVVLVLAPKSLVMAFKVHTVNITEHLPCARPCVGRWAYRLNGGVFQVRQRWGRHVI